ncbi:related to Flavohemoprotein [Saccharomycodes ludwigii]|uniref:nitric oxide dioxygenase n=2 Tax=Saccharomycodes ludwigii TaxID=36035 RepID=A0A376BC96_9ASCO|nr:related to Flavohemoprotein [Saccharomycodes ludwigii]
MLSENPKLLDIFNKRNQMTGAQPTALAMTVLAAAKHIDDLTVLLPQVTQIGYKHRALQVQPEHYPIVGKYLIRSIKEIVNPPQEILTAWKEAYQVIADIFIGVEKDMYAKELWKGWEKFTIINKLSTNKSGSIVEFVVKPLSSKVFGNNGKSSKIFEPGQYITVRTKPPTGNDGHYALRHYSICDIETPGVFKFAVKLADKGLVSHYLIDDVNVGDEIELSAPSGDFSLDHSLLNKDEYPLIFMSSGSGATPLISMLQEQVMKGSPTRPIVWIQTNKSELEQPFAETIERELSKLKNSENIQIYTNQNMGRIDAKFLEEKNIVRSKADIYICGSLSFMNDIIGLLEAEKETHDYHRLHYEPFGPKMSIA